MEHELRPEPSLTVVTGERHCFDFTQPQTEEVQRTAALLCGKEASLWVFDNPGVEARWRGVVKTGYQCLLANPPNTVAATEIADRVQKAIEARVADRRRDNIWQRWAMALLAVALVAALAAAGAVRKDLALATSIPLWVLLLGAAGGAASGLIALRSEISITSNGPLRVFAACSRPLLGAVTGALLYLLVASGAVAITVGTSPQLFHTFVALAGGFSERLLGHAVGQTLSLVGAVTPPDRRETQS